MSVRRSEVPPRSTSTSALNASSAQPAPPAQPPTAPPTPPGLTATGRVILGMLAFGKETGYEIKQLVDKSTRHFWAASYGQIYPELRRLEAAGLVKSRSEPLGGRARTAYRLTVAGRQTFADWLQSSHEPLYELRDEGMLKLFFSDLGQPDLALEHLNAMRARHQRKLEQLRALQPVAEAGPAGPCLTLQLGIGLTEWMINWCEAALHRLEASEKE
jgi:PadR family transcriptional regulator, regulatory protein AphA